MVRSGMLLQSDLQCRLVRDSVGVVKNRGGQQQQQQQQQRQLASSWRGRLLAEPPHYALEGSDSERTWRMMVAVECARFKLRPLGSGWREVTGVPRENISPHQIS